MIGFVKCVYANKNIYLFLGGFMLALGIESSGLHKRIALKMIISVGSSGKRLVGGFMLVAALISMWVMNTSTTLMLLPIGLAVCGVMSETIPGLTDKDKSNFDTALLLGIAYAATIGGMSTLIGTAPNIVFSAFIMMPLTLLNLPTQMPSINAFTAAAWLGSISTGLAFFGYVYLIEKIGAVKTSTVAYFLPIFGIIWGSLFLNEVITPGILLGCGTILVGVFLATSNKKSLSTGDIHAN